jgi:hypothetical protein
MGERAINREEAEIGMWWATCCLHDLHRIDNEQDLQDAKEGAPYMDVRVWSSLKDALLDLLPDESSESLEWWLDFRRESYPSDYTEIRKAVEEAHAN